MIAKPVHLLGVPMDLGGGLRGVDMGPSAIRIAGLGAAVAKLGLEFEDRGNLLVQRPDPKAPVDPNARYLKEIAACCRNLAEEVREVLSAGGLPLVVGGDHSIACGTVAGISGHYHSQGQKIGLIWFDAHADMNTPGTSPSGNVHGMPLAACLGRGPQELVAIAETTPYVDVKNAVLIGIRDVDKQERELVHESGIKAFTMRDIDILGMNRVMQEALEIAGDGTAGFHLSFDLDGCDPDVAPGVGTPVHGGITQRESHLVMEHAAESKKLLGLEITELNPIVDEANRTGRLAVELILSALGKRIL